MTERLDAAFQAARTVAAARYGHNLNRMRGILEGKHDGMHEVLFAKDVARAVFKALEAGK